MSRSDIRGTFSAAMALTCVAALCPPRFLRAENWSGILSPERAADWSKAGIPGGVPRRTTILATLAPGATAGDINRAIASCPGGQVVLLCAGTCTLSPGIDFANHGNVTLRGAGADRTFLIFTGGDDTTGHVYANPAEACCRSAPRDESYPEDQSGNRILAFNAGRYHYPASSSAP
jgi:hypothetical protein